MHNFQSSIAFYCSLLYSPDTFFQHCLLALPCVSSPEFRFDYEISKINSIIGECQFAAIYATNAHISMDTVSTEKLPMLSGILSAIVFHIAVYLRTLRCQGLS